MIKKILLILILLITLAGFFVYRVKIKNFGLDLIKEKPPEPIEYQNVDESRDAPRRVPTDSINLDIPFTPQAPLADWDETFKEACEEASVLMVDYYYKNKTLTPAIATEEILRMVDWQKETWGGHFDLTAAQTAAMIKEYLGYTKVEIIDNPTVDDIKFHLNQKRPVIIPAAGQKLSNPYFRQPGPIYHMLVIKGYAENQFITNDPGTKRGENYLYDYQLVMEAMHDWNNENIRQGAKKIIVIYPN